MISMMLMDDDDVDDDDDDYDDDLAAFQNDYYHARSKMTIITRSKTTPSRSVLVYEPIKSQVWLYMEIGVPRNHPFRWDCP